MGPKNDDYKSMVKKSSRKNLSRQEESNKDTKPVKKVVSKTTSSDVTSDVVPSGPNSLSVNQLFRLADFHFNKKNYIFRHLYDSYNKFIEEDVKNFLEFGDHVFTEKVSQTKYFKYRFKFENIRVDEPALANGVEPMFPSDARHSRQTYSLKIIADVTQFQDVYDMPSDRKITKTIGRKEENFHIATIPLMVRSRWCSLSKHKNMDKSECEFDAGGYFIVNGNEKVVISQDRMVENKPLVFIKKDSGALSHVVQVNSKSYRPHGMTQVLNVKMKNKDNILMLRVPILNEVNVCAVFRALGLESDREIISYITYDEFDTDMVDIIRTSIDACKNDKGVKISSQEEAIDYLIQKLRVIKKYSETDKDSRLHQKKEHLKHLLEFNFLPHKEGGMLEKAYYLGYMINRLLRVYLGRLPLDDRDSYINKRIDLTGDLMFDLFKQQYKKLLGECKKFFDNRNKSDDDPINVISNIKPGIIEQGFKASLSTGHWIRRQGVAQMLQRLTYLQTLSFLRRVDAPGGDASTSKLTSPRHLHPSSVPFLCCCQSPEHVKVGLTKHLSLIGSITIMSRDQYSLLKDFMSQQVTKTSDLSCDILRNNEMYKVFLNGDWLGVTSKYLELEKTMNDMKFRGDFDQKNVSIVADHEEGEIRVYCDSGRLVRPVLRVENNIVQLNKKHIDSISLNKSDSMHGKVTDWDEFLVKYPEVIEYVDMELQPFMMIADKVKTVEHERKKMLKSIDLSKNVSTNHVDNRYDEMFYVNYTHSEIHPALLVGEIVTNIPFYNSDAGARCMFAYAQGRQAMGIYATNYRDRLDISFIMYNPERALVSTRTAKYTNSEILPAGVNAMVAIACYTGL